MSYSEPSPCKWCQNQIDAGTQSPCQRCYVQFVEKQVIAGQTYERVTNELCTNRSPELLHPNGMRDEKYFKDQAISRLEYWGHENESMNCFAVCGAQYLGKEK